MERYRRRGRSGRLIYLNLKRWMWSDLVEFNPIDISLKAKELFLEWKIENVNTLRWKCGSVLDVRIGFFLQMGFTLILATLDGLDVGLLGDVIGEDDCDDDG
ncbi:hypothetical protein Tco_1062848 [Tanacetum coccineum]